MVPVYQDLATLITPERYAHTMGVKQVAQELASIYGVDQRKAELAALLHDCAKDLPPETLLKMASSSGILVDAVERADPDLLHGQVGAVIAEQKYGVRDPEVLSAIKYHTTGVPEMGRLTEIIYVADFVEPGRPFPEAQVLRQIAKVDIDKAAIEIMDLTISWVIREGKLLHPRTVEARNWFLMKKT